MELGKVFVPVENSKTYSVGTCLGHPTPAAQVTTRLPRHSLTATADTLIATTHPPDPATPTRGLSYWYSTCRARIIQVILFCEKEAWKPWKPMERSLYTIHLLPSHNFGLFRICRILRFFNLLQHCNKLFEHTGHPNLQMKWVSGKQPKECSKVFSNLG